MKARTFGRMSPLGYFITLLLTTVGLIGSYFLVMILVGYAGGGSALAKLSLMAPFLALIWAGTVIMFSVMRLRDMDANPFLILITLIPFINIIFIIILCLVPGTPGVNKYGPDVNYFNERRKQLMTTGLTWNQAVRQIYRETNLTPMPPTQETRITNDFTNLK